MPATDIADFSLFPHVASGYDGDGWERGGDGGGGGVERSSANTAGLIRSLEREVSCESEVRYWNIAECATETDPVRADRNEMRDVAEEAAGAGGERFGSGKTAAIDMQQINRKPSRANRAK